MPDRNQAGHSESAQLREWLGTALSKAPIICFALDRQGVFTLSEGAGLATIGLMPGEVVGRSVDDVYKDSPDIRRAVKRALKGESLTMTTELGRSSFEAWLSPLLEPNGVVRGVIGIVTDVTERRRMENKMVQTDRIVAMGTLAASVAHEINNPLSYLIESLRSIERELSAARLRLPSAVALERISTHLALAADGAERVRLIARDLKTFSRADDRALTAVDLRAVLERALQRVSNPLANRARWLFEVPELPRVEANEARLVQVFLNLLLNAMQAIPEGRPEANEVRITATVEGCFVQVDVADSGPGVPPELRTRIFEPFFTTKPLGEGTGLGLFVCRNLVEAAGGTLTVHERAGGGALFRVRLPVTRKAEDAASPEVQEQAPTKETRRILIVDDDVRLGAALRIALEPDYEVVVSSSGREALQRLAAREMFDLILCDLMMGDLTGMDLYEQLQTHCPGRERELVFMTGGAFTSRALAFLDRVPNPRLEKPFDVRKVAAQFLGRTPAD